METSVFETDLGLKKTLQQINNEYVRSGLSYGWKGNPTKEYDYGHWNKLILAESRTVPYDHSLLPYIEKHPLILEVWNHVKKLIGYRALLRCYINGYTYGTDSYAHTDETKFTEKFGKESVGETVIVYLNEEWNIDWAGETVIYDDGNDIEKAVLPKFGRILVFDSDKLHAARPVSRACPVLRSVLVFKTFDLKFLSPEITFLLEKTKNVPHSHSNFFNHLYNTMKILEDRKESRDLCLAGLYHSIYGTESFEFNDSYFDRESVRNIIGEYAEKLVYEFCTVKNRLETFINDPKNYNVNFRKDLLKLEQANLIDQNTSGQFDRAIAQIELEFTTVKGYSRPS